MPSDAEGLGCVIGGHGATGSHSWISGAHRIYGSDGVCWPRPASGSAGPADSPTVRVMLIYEHFHGTTTK